MTYLIRAEGVVRIDGAVQAMGVDVRGEDHTAASWVHSDIAQVERVLAVRQENLLEGRPSVNRPPHIGAPAKEQVLNDDNKSKTEKRTKLNIRK